MEANQVAIHGIGGANCPADFQKMMMKMNRGILRIKLLVAVLFATTLCNAQVTVSTNQLNGTEWEFVSVNMYDKIYLDEDQVNTIKFGMTSYTDSTYYKLIDMDGVFQRPYYISNTEPSYTYFDRSKVGVNATGKYIVDYNDKLNGVDYWTIVSFTNDEMVWLHKSQEDAYNKLDAYITFKRVKKDE